VGEGSHTPYSYGNVQYCQLIWGRCGILEKGISDTYHQRGFPVGGSGGIFTHKIFKIEVLGKEISSPGVPLNPTNLSRSALG